MASPVPSVSVVVPMHNAELWIDDCLQSVLTQKFAGKLELSIYNDASTDRSLEIVERWRTRLQDAGICLSLGGHDSGEPKGVGFAKNCAVYQSCGEYICFLDADDIMHPNRVQLQLEAAQKHQGALIGSKFSRLPPKSTERYTRWCNSLSCKQLLTQRFTSFGPTIIQPTWFCHRSVFDAAGPFAEGGKGVPEDLIFFHKHLQLGNDVHRVDKRLLFYRYHPSAMTFSVNRQTIWDIQVKEFEKSVLCHWPSFTIWNAGKQGRHFYKSLTEENRQKVIMFCDVDSKKISKGCYTFENAPGFPKPRIPIVHFKCATPPFAICVKWDLTHGVFEMNLASMNLEEGKDYYHLS
ncbi:UDP-GlcNAc:betaGal beta-1,3-N-acetylglucosaminyltransferase-like protein 1 [Corticium candelabrum]|uniref:UDP-GlcNAc:betaGal beta-1,3-N-acetylglucosaminyltransferase-like protein 1 n=1 Tax=Corticium candelabrum TaxID=121492 RepID=UPI002E3741CA|nr:UDP-GlcNAc:betaGal beta-1,3-N-acetylglucosaminyltransferase-like protein 1 [Corticium candelabrum]